MNEQGTHIDLFSGIGGFALAARWTGFRTVAFCECEPYAQRVLRKHWPDVPIHDDVRTFPGVRYAGATLLTGGFPCQPFSLAGKRAGKEDDRFLWPAMVAVIEAVRPTWVIGENVPGIVTMELDRCAADLEAQGYAVWPVIVPACAVGAFHRRDRVWIVAHRDGAGMERSENAGIVGGGGKKCDELTFGCSEVWSMAHAGRRSGEGPGRVECGQTDAAWWEPEPDVGGMVDGLSYGMDGCFRWPAEPDIGRVATGITNRVQRLKGLGNSIVPQIACQLMRFIVQSEHENVY